MAESAVKSAAEWLGKLLVEEGKYLWGAEGKIEELQDELLWMQSFLRDADTVKFDDEIVGMWVLKVKEYVAEAEDIIDDFVVKVASRRRRTGWKNKLKIYSCFLEEPVAVHNVASRIDCLKDKISMLSSKLKDYGLKTSYGMKTYRTREAQIAEIQQSREHQHLDNDEIIGLKQNTQDIVHELKKGEPGRKVVAIYGMGGLGKTTLATKVFHHEEIKQHFSDGRAWIYISQQFKVHSVLQTLLADLTSNSIELFYRKDVKYLIPELRDFLKKKKCLVVLDDVWKKHDWDMVSAAFTTCGESGSKVLLTTRKGEVAEYVDENALRKPDTLSEEESWELLLQKVGWLKGVESDGIDVQKKHIPIIKINDEHRRAQNENAGSSEADICSAPHGMAETENVQTSEVDTGRGDGHGTAQTKKFKSGDVIQMIKLGKEMLKHCNGLPLAVILLGGILRKKETLDEWQSVHDNFISYLRRGNERGTTFMEVLVQSYNDLPYHLKSCFLHLGNFPEDYEISTEKLYWMWMAEGLVTWSQYRIAGTESLEDVANDYLCDLAQAGVVEVVKKRANGRIKSIRIHDLTRDVCLQKAVAENSLNIIDHRPCPNKPLSISSNFAHKRLLRMAIYLAHGVQNFIPDSLSSKAHRYLRSLLFIAEHGAEIDDSGSALDIVPSKRHRCLRSLLFIIGRRGEWNKYQQWMDFICNEFQWLRVLDVEGFRLEGRLTKQIQNLIHLRYLSLKGTRVTELPSSIGNLRFLEILDLRVSYAGSPVKIPGTLWKLDRLSRLLLPSVSYEIKSSKKLRLDTLICLGILKNLEVSNSRLKDLQKLENLRKISFKGTVPDMESLNYILQTPALKSANFRSCSLVVKGNVISENPGILSSYNCIHRLHMVEQISASIEKVAFPHFLKTLRLESCRLQEDPMDILGSLFHLKDLFLGMDSYVGTEIICKAENFPMLGKLNLQGLLNLENWTVEHGSMPELNMLMIKDCPNLKIIPHFLPISVRVTCRPCIRGVEKHGGCIYNDSVVGCHEEMIIGIEDDADFLSNQLLDEKYSIIVLSGRPGIGKDTLARMLLSLPGIRQHFEASSWAYFASRCSFSESYVDPPRRILQGILRDLAPDISNVVLSTKKSVDLVKEIQSVVEQKKCLLILTTCLNPDNVGRLMSTFGCKSFERGSKLLLISNMPEDSESDTLFQQDMFHVLRPFVMDRRNKILPSGMMAQNKLIKRHLAFLNDEQMLTLFLQRCKHIVDDNDHARLEIVQKKMMQQCSGHLLSIRMLAGLMATKKTIEEWEIMSRELSSLQPRNDQPLSKIFSLCYNDLPPHLRYCFLCLANFPQEIEISTEKLFRLWIAAGFVRLQDDKDQTDEFLENLAENYLAELVQRGMVKVGQRRPTGRIKTCRLHCAAYHLCLEKASEEQFLTIINDQSKISSSASNANLTTTHLAIHLNQDENNIFPASTSSDGGQLSSVRSLLYVPNISDPECKEESWDWFKTICNQFTSLVILDLEGMRTTNGNLPTEVVNLSQLRYLSLKETWVRELPSSIEKLTKLQTLDLRVMESIVIPDVLWKLKYLRHLYLLDHSVAPPTRKLQLYGLAHLLTVTNLCTEKINLNHVPSLALLRKISIRNIDAVKELDETIGSLDTSLELTINSEIVNRGENILSCFQNLHKVRIKGRISDSVRLRSQMFPAQLKELTLKHTKLKEDPIPVLEKLLNLRRLFFDHESFLGKKMTFSGDFRHLTHLSFRLLSNLEELNNPNADMWVLKSLMIISCWRLQKHNVRLRSDDMLLS